MPKSAQAFRTIREVADWLDVAAHVLRFWESKFNQIKPVKRAGGRRYYRPADMELVGGIKVLLHDRGLTIRGVQKMIADEGLESVTSLSPSVDELLNGAEVIDLDPSDEWAEDAAAEEAIFEQDQAVEGDTSSAILEEAEENTAETIAPPDTAEPPDVLPEPEPVDLPEPEAEPEDLPEPAEVAQAEAPVSADTTTDTTDDAPEAADTPEPPTPATPFAPPPLADPAEGTLGALAIVARLPASQRASLAPHIADLARLRDRMRAAE